MSTQSSAVKVFCSRCNTNSSTAKGWTLCKTCKPCAYLCNTCKEFLSQAGDALYVTHFGHELEHFASAVAAPTAPAATEEGKAAAAPFPKRELWLELMMSEVPHTTPCPATVRGVSMSTCNCGIASIMRNVGDAELRAFQKRFQDDYMQVVLQRFTEVRARAEAKEVAMEKALKDVQECHRARREQMNKALETLQRAILQDKFDVRMALDKLRAGAKLVDIITLD